MEQTSSTYVTRALQHLGKSVADSRDGAELIVAVEQPPQAGINFGPGDQCLGQLLVFAHDSSQGDRRGELLWVESFYGQPDRPWPFVVTALVDQFEDRFKKPGR